MDYQKKTSSIMIKLKLFMEMHSYFSILNIPMRRRSFQVKKNKKNIGWKNFVSTIVFYQIN